MDRRTLYVDVDDTLLMHDRSAFVFTSEVTVKCKGRTFVGVPNKKNINLLVKFYKLGYDVIVWSKTGASWARAVGGVLGINEYVSHYLSKPDFYMDDRDAKDWMGQRVYRDPLTGEE